MKVPAHIPFTIVDTEGKVLRQGSDGVIVVSYSTDSKEHKPIFSVQEVSDNEVVNAFLYLPPEAEIMRSDIEDSLLKSQAWEILINRNNHQPLQEVDVRNGDSKTIHFTL